MVKSAVISSSESSLASGSPTILDTNSSERKTQQGAGTEHSEDILLYERLEVAGLAALLVCFVVLLLFSCYKWRVTQQRYAQKQKSRLEGWRQQRDISKSDSRRPMITVPNPTSSSEPQRTDHRPLHQHTSKYGPFPYKINPIYAEHDEMDNGAFIDSGTPRGLSEIHPVSLHEPSPLPFPPRQLRDDSTMTSGRDEERPIPKRRPVSEADSEVTSDSGQIRRSQLVEMVAESMRSDPDLEASMRELAGSEWKDEDVTTILDQLTTKSLRDTYDEIQRLKSHPLGLSEESD